MATPNGIDTARAKFEIAREMAFGDITNSFTMIDTVFDLPFSIFYAQNLTDQIIDFSISFEGTDTTFSLLPGGTLSSDMVTNNIQISSGEAAFAKYRDTPPTSGFIQIIAITAV